MWLVTLVEMRNKEELEKLPDPVAITTSQSLQWEPVQPVVLLHDAEPTEACNCSPCPIASQSQPLQTI